MRYLKPHPKQFIKQTAVALPMHTLNLSLPVGSGYIATDCPLDDFCNQFVCVRSIHQFVLSWTIVILFNEEWND